MLAVLLLFVFCGKYVECLSCGKNFTCTPTRDCDYEGALDILYPCESGNAVGRSSVCCPDPVRTVVSRTAQFPERCGYLDLDDKVTGGKNAAIGQFPWMALLGYKTDFIDFTQFLCGGSLITKNFVLTAAHCLYLPSLKLELARLGEWNTATAKDCENATGTVFCAQPHLDVPIAEILPHHKYNNVSLTNDIALLRLKTAVTFTDFIQPICLPFDMSLPKETFYGKRLTVSGWGKTASDNLAGSDILQYTSVTVWAKDRCNAAVPPEARPIKDRQICANGANAEDSCKGDSGGPIFNATVGDGTVRFYQYGVVSFSSARLCGNPDLPTVYTRIDSYLKWIITKVK